MVMDKDTSDCNPVSSADGQTTSKPSKSCCASLKMFLAALCFSYFAKAFAGSYMKSSITQIERRFDVSSSVAGFIDGSFEFGNLLMIAFVSYFGAKLHRPRIIAAGCLVMSFGSFLSAMPHFFMGPYKYETSVAHKTVQNNITEDVSLCSANQTFLDYNQNDCGKEFGSYLWLFIMIGNLLRGIGETPITPLGISYLDDFSRPENTPLYIAFLHTTALFGPMTGFMVGSLCARLYVDIGFTDLDKISITPQDTRWVGAWWMGFIVAGALTLLSAIPFFFIPKSLKKQSEKAEENHESCKIKEESEKSNTKTKTTNKPTMKGFFKALKSLCCNRLYVMLMFLTLLQTNSFIGFITYKPKYMEQQFGQSTSKSNFITGVSTLPAAALGMFLGGLIMKKYKFGLLGATKLSFATSFVAFLLSLSAFFLSCDNNDVAGITVTYDGYKQDAFKESFLYSSCNSPCSCSVKKWDPVCGENQMTYMSACLAGCTSFIGTGKNKVYHNCTCIKAAGFQSHNYTASLGVCPRDDSCSRMFLYYIISGVISTFIYALGAASGYILLLWTVTPEIKALAVGVYMLLIRALAGIPAPTYFGALIDKTCFKWGTRLCGGRGACRMYNNNAFRNTFLGLMAGIRTVSYIFSIAFFFMVKKQVPTGIVKSSNENQSKELTNENVYTKCASDEQHLNCNIQNESCM